MKEHPIIFSGPMVRAILAGQKTVTRRLVKLPRWAEPGTLEEGTEGVLAVARVSGCLADVPCPYGAPGDDLWVRETWASQGAQLVAYQADGECGAWMGDGAGGRVWIFHGWVMQAERRETHNLPGRRWGLAARGGRWRPSIHMPRWASRLDLEVVSVRAEQLHAIDDTEAVREGVLTLGVSATASPREVFAGLWDSINGERAPWRSNPWVWRVEFNRVEVPRG